MNYIASLRQSINSLKKLEDDSPDEITPENMVNFERFFLKNNKTDL